MAGASRPEVVGPSRVRSQRGRPLSDPAATRGFSRAQSVGERVARDGSCRSSAALTSCVAVHGDCPAIARTVTSLSNGRQLTGADARGCSCTAKPVALAQSVAMRPIFPHQCANPRLAGDQRSIRRCPTGAERVPCWQTVDALICAPGADFRWSFYARPTHGRPARDASAPRISRSDMHRAGVPSDRSG